MLPSATAAVTTQQIASTLVSAVDGIVWHQIANRTRCAEKTGSAQWVVDATVMVAVRVIMIFAGVTLIISHRPQITTGLH